METAPPTNKSDAIQRRHELAERQRTSLTDPNGDPGDPSPQADHLSRRKPKSLVDPPITADEVLVGSYKNQKCSDMASNATDDICRSTPVAPR